ncbi:winged helix-turn-helix domain-containing protein [Rubrivirga sp. IMCC45206]|uniref:winged helix-turn-helix domain-containing protein n=1 Tax=Rubrivirga sp. IMCC45206 TaxID=3391614 RepID=UPI00398FC99D
MSTPDEPLTTGEVAGERAPSGERRYRFGPFVLDPSERQLWEGEARVDLNARYFDALVLLVREHGRLVEKDRFFEEVWDDVVVSDSALTQCVKEVRQRLGDDASAPRFIETVPRHGYRFIGPVEALGSPPVEPAAAAPAALSPPPTQAGLSAPSPSASGPARRWPLRTAALWAGAGALGGASAGVLGGLLYGSALAYAGAGLGTASVLVVLLALNVLVGLVGGAGVGAGMAAVAWARRRPFAWSVVGAALGGLGVGGAAKLLGADAFQLLFGQAPAGFTGGLEGAALGVALALGARLGDAGPRWGAAAGAGAVGALAGGLIPRLGGHLMGGSLDLVARTFPGSRLRLDALGRLFGEADFGPVAQSALGGVEGLVFGACVAGALVAARAALAAPETSPGA